ncbi:hypothetical protein ACVGOW_18230 [Pseudonocardia saturnea]
MQTTRYVARVAAAGALAVLVAAGIVVGVAGGAAAAESTSAEHAGGPTNRGWTAPVGAADEFADRSQ